MVQSRFEFCHTYKSKISKYYYLVAIKLIVIESRLIEAFQMLEI